MLGELGIFALFAFFVFRILIWGYDFFTFWRRVNLIPGPKGWPLFGNAPEMVSSIRKKRLANLLSKEWPRKYGPVYRFWAGPFVKVSLGDAHSLEPILSSTRQIKKSVGYRFVRPWLGDGLITSTGEKWKTRRRLLTHAFHFTLLERFLPIFVAETNTFVNVIREEMKKGKACNVLALTSLLTLDVICECAMGVRIDAQIHRDSLYVREVQKLESLVNTRIFTPWFFWDFLYNLTSDGREHKKLLKVVHEFTRRVIEEKRALLKKEDKPEKEPEPGKKIAFLDLLLSPALRLSDNDIQEEVDTFMFAGHDTTAAGISWCLYLLGLHPDIQDKAYDEVLSITDDGDSSKLMANLHELKYLECNIKESQRVYPTVPFVERELVEDLEVGSYIIPKGAQVVIQMQAAHKNPDVFPDPEKFDPGRFLPSEVAGRHPYAFIPFSAGPRNCIGDIFAWKTPLDITSHHNDGCFRIDPDDKFVACVVVRKSCM